MTKNRVVTNDFIKKVSPYLTAGYGEKVKAYLRAGAKALRGENYYPNSRVGDNGIIVSS